MKVLTIHEPYASLIIAGLKHYETRSWTRKYRGPLAIHVAGTFTKKDYFALCRVSQHQIVKDCFGQRFDSHTVFPGHIIGVVDLADMQPVPDVKPLVGALEITAGYWDRTNFAWRLENPRVFEEPYRIKGAQGLWNWTPPPGWEANLFDVTRKAEAAP